MKITVTVLFKIFTYVQNITKSRRSYTSTFKHGAMKFKTLAKSLCSLVIHWKKCIVIRSHLEHPRHFCNKKAVLLNRVYVYHITQYFMNWTTTKHLSYTNKNLKIEKKNCFLIQETKTKRLIYYPYILILQIKNNCVYIKNMR